MKRTTFFLIDKQVRLLKCPIFFTANNVVLEMYPDIFIGYIIPIAYSICDNTFYRISKQEQFYHDSQL